MATPHFYAFYFWLNPKVTKDQEPIKGDFAFGKPRSLLPLHAFIASLFDSSLYLLSRENYNSNLFYFFFDTRDRNSARRAAYHW